MKEFPASVQGEGGEPDSDEFGVSRRQSRRRFLAYDGERRSLFVMKWDVAWRSLYILP
nr:hypothetical protein Itr_chr03CG10800 [Ipomoea trifida]GMC71830.1 hypothetical protein Iba_chr03bCG6180 [Ipomoea batatas]GMC73875.1 hypothetical protein Iba_chr03cCG4900 [Ipomoea batatas]GMC84131.1 hypothetical protein Iba_scaffold35768CG0010 [Ipomoea batatas]GMD00015.1 hypothetical protein Iba_chr05eCG11170 [Ipomoea batatas]